jgi:hypothetical protein
VDFDPFVTGVNALNRRAHGKQNLPFYLLINLLHKEASLASLQIRLVSEKKMKRNPKKSTKIFKQVSSPTGIDTRSTTMPADS